MDVRSPFRSSASGFNQTIAFAAQNCFRELTILLLKMI